MNQNSNKMMRIYYFHTTNQWQYDNMFTISWKSYIFFAFWTKYDFISLLTYIWIFLQMFCVCFLRLPESLDNFWFMVLQSWISSFVKVFLLIFNIIQTVAVINSPRIFQKRNWIWIHNLIGSQKIYSFIRFLWAYKML